MSRAPAPHRTRAVPPGVPRPQYGAIRVLDGIRVSWEWLCAPPHPVSLPATAIPGLGAGPLPLDEIRARLLDRATPGPVRDAVWSHLIHRSRVEGPTWTVACAGMALPMLATVCRQLCGGAVDMQREDVASGVVGGFVAALASLDLARPGVASALRWAAVRGGNEVLREQRRAPSPVPHDRLLHAALTRTTRPATPTEPEIGAKSEGGAESEGGTPERTVGLGPGLRSESAPPPTVGGHPDLVLADAVADGVLSRAEAALIGETRLEAVTLAQAANRRGRPVGSVTMQRLRAEMRLVDHLRTPPATTTDTRADARTESGGPNRAGVSDTGQHVPRSRRSRGRRSRTVTGQPARTERPRVPRCGREQSHPVNTTHPSTGGGGRGADGQVTR